MPGLTAAAAGSAWTYGASILTFVFPMLLFLFVGATLWVLFTKPVVIPGHRDPANGWSVGSTRVARPPAGPAPAPAGPTTATSAGEQATAAEGEAG